MTGSLAKRYARALLGLAHERHALDRTGEELARVTAIFDEPRLRAVVLNPGIDAGARRHIVAEVVVAIGVSDIVGNLVRLLADRDRVSLLPDLLRAYEGLVDQSLGRTHVRVRSAVALSPSEKTNVAEVARRLVGGEVVVRTDVDPELLGGVVLDAAGTVYDGSVRTQLERLGKQIAGEGV